MQYKISRKNRIFEQLVINHMQIWKIVSFKTVFKVKHHLHSFLPMYKSSNFRKMYELGKDFYSACPTGISEKLFDGTDHCAFSNAEIMEPVSIMFSHIPVSAICL